MKMTILREWKFTKLNSNIPLAKKPKAKGKAARMTSKAPLSIGIDLGHAHRRQGRVVGLLMPPICPLLVDLVDLAWANFNH